MQFLISHNTTFTDVDLLKEENQLYSMTFNKPTPIFVIQVIEGDGDAMQNLSLHRIRVERYNNLFPGAFVRLKRVREIPDLAQFIEETEENPDQCVATINNGMAWPIRIVKNMPKKEKALLEANIDNKKDIKKFWGELRDELNMFDDFFQPKPKLDPKKFTPDQIKRASEMLCINCDNEIKGKFFFKDTLSEAYEKNGLCQECQYGTNEIVEDLSDPEEYLKRHEINPINQKSDVPVK